MPMKASFRITVGDKFFYDGYQEIIRDLKAMPEVRAIKPVSGQCKLLVQVEAPTRAIMIAHKIMALKWVKHVDILTVDPGQHGEHPRPLREVRERLKTALAARNGPVRAPKGTTPPELDEYQEGT